MSRSRAAMKAWVASLAYTASTMLTGFVVTPIVLNTIGQDRFGTSRVLTDVLAYLAIAAQGITLSLVPRMASAAGRNDRDGLERCLAVGFKLYAVTSVVLTLIGLAITPVLGPLMHVAVPFRPELRTSWLILLVSVSLTMFAPMKVLIDIAHKGYVSNLMMAVQGVSTAILTIILVRSGWGIPGVALSLLAGTVFFTVSTTVAARRLYPRLISSIFRARPTREDWTSVLAISGPTFVANISERIGVLSDSILLAGIRNPASVAILSNTQKLAQLGFTILNAMSLAIWPSIAELYARGQKQLLSIRLIELTRLIGLLGVAGLAPVIAYNSHFVERWLGPGNDGGRAIVIVVAINSIGLTLVSIYNVALVSTGKVARLAKPAAISAVLNVVMSVLFTLWLGAIGPVLGTLVSTVLVQSWYLPFQLRQVFGVSRRGLLWGVTYPLLWGVPYTCCLCLIADSYKPSGWFSLLGAMAIAASVFLVFGIMVILGPDDRNLWNARLVTPLLGKFRRTVTTEA